VVELAGLLVERTVIMGVGNWLKRDDALGPLVIKALTDRGFAKYPLLDAGTTPENHLGRIARLRPDLLLIIDAADFGAEPGTIALFRPDEISLNSFSTHNLSLKTFAEYLKQTLHGLKVVLLGVQPADAGLGEGVSRPVGAAIERIAGLFIARQ